MAGSRSLGVLTLDLVAKLGGFTAGLDKADRESAKAAKQIEKNLESINVAAYAVGNALGEYIVRGIDAIASAFPRLIENAAKFQDLAEETGASAEDLAGFAVAAATAGVAIESVAGASVKLTKSLVGVDDESKAAGAAIEALGLNVAQFKQLDPAAQYEAIGKALSGYADGAGKTAIAVALFGKAGAEQLKVFKALEEQGGRSNILTKEQIKLADDYADRQAKVRAELGLYASALATQTLPALTAFTGAMTDTIKEVLNLGKGASDLGANQGVRDFADNAAIFFANVIDLAGKVVTAFKFVGETVGATAAIVAAANRDSFEATKSAFSFDPKGLLDTVKRQARDIGNIFGDAREQGKKYAAETISFADQVNKRIADRKAADAQARLETRGFDPRPKVKFDGAVTPPKKGGGAKDDPTKALLDNELKALENQVKQEQELLQSRNKFLDLYNGQGLISVRDYYAQKQTILDDAVAKQSAAYDAEIAALQKYIASAPKATERAAGEGKLNDVIEKQAKLHREAGLSAIESSIKQVEAQKKVQAAVDEVNAKILEFNGNLREAAAIRFDASNEGLKNTFTAEGNALALKQLETLRSYTLAQADLNKTTQAFALAQGDLSIAEERIEIARKRGTMGEIEALNASGEARRSAVAVMEKQLAVLLAINDAARSPEQNQQIERLKVQLEGLKATVDPLADKFNTLISDAAGNAFGDYITGAKTAKQAFTDFANSVINDITRMVAKDLAKSLFGGGSGGGAGGWLSALFGGGGGGGKDLAGADALFLKAAGMASGGYTGTGSMFEPAGIVHRGEYVLDAETTRRLGVENLNRVNAGGTMGGYNQTVNISVEGTPRTETINQIANETRRVTMKATRLS